jgi:hypothetical protein
MLLDRTQEVYRMKVEFRNLYQIAVGGPFSLWHYRTEHEYGALLDHGYWNGCSNMFRVGDMIVAKSHGENTILFVTEVAQAPDTVRSTVRVTAMQSVSS